MNATSFSYTPFGWVLLFGGVTVLLCVLRSAQASPEETAAVFRKHRHLVIEAPDRERMPEREPGLIIGLVFALVFAEILARHWFLYLSGIIPFFGMSAGIGHQLLGAAIVGLLIGGLAFAVVHVAAGLERLGRRIARRPGAAMGRRARNKTDRPALFLTETETEWMRSRMKKKVCQVERDASRRPT